jgi:CRP/FNR family transcriptional regulator, cyclic AMP receptor protein
MAVSSEATLRMFRFAEDYVAFSAGAQIFHEGENGEVMYVVKDGLVDILVHDKVVETLGPGGILGEMALIDSQPRSGTAIAKTDCTLVPIDARRFNFLVQANPAFALEVMRVMATRLRKMDANA